MNEQAPYIHVSRDRDNFNYRLLHEIGPWEDQALDVPRQDYVEKMAPYYAEQATFLDESRQIKDLSFPRLLRSVVEATDPEAPISEHAHEFFEIGRQLGPAEQAALYTNTVTEKNLETYVRILAEKFGAIDEFVLFLRSWASDEQQHDEVLSDLSKFAFPHQYGSMQEDANTLIHTAEAPNASDPFSITSYTDKQEPATRLNHMKLARRIGNKGLKNMILEIAGDEGTHGVAYLELSRAHMNHYPDQHIVANAQTIRRFFMPGKGMNDFESIKDTMAAAGIFDVLDLYEIFNKNARDIDLDSIEYDLHPEAEKALEDTKRFLKILRRKGEREHRQRLDRISHQETYSATSPLTGQVNEMPYKASENRKVSDLALS